MSDKGLQIILFLLMMAVFMGGGSPVSMVARAGASIVSFITALRP